MLRSVDSSNDSLGPDFQTRAVSTISFEDLRIRDTRGHGL